MTIPKSALPNINQLHVFANNLPVNSSSLAITSNTTDYFVYITFTFHSPVLIDVQLQASDNATFSIFGLNPTLFYGLALGLAVIIAFPLGYRARIRNRARQKTPLLGSAWNRPIDDS